MRYAFYMKETTKNSIRLLVAKIPKDVNPESYNLETMKKDIEA
jgi:hypothetical protein